MLYIFIDIDIYKDDYKLIYVYTYILDATSTAKLMCRRRCVKKRKREREPSKYDLL